jgi:serine/threonine protein kinase
MIRLIDGVEYAKGGRMKTRMMLPWYAEGNLLQALDSLSPEERFSICHQLFQIVRGLEAKGWVYRDLKGDNILISHDAEGKVQVTLCDAGAMHKRGLGSAPQLMGPSEFMAPEYAYVKTEACQELRQSLVLQFTTSKLDVWGCGVLVAGLLVPAVYQKLFPDEHSAKESSQWYQEGEIPVLEALDPSSLWHRFLQRVLNPCPDRRLSPEEALSQFEALFVVGRPPADGDGSVDLLEKQEAGHLVGEGHRGERQLA